jgi:transcriptional regulator with XRE-family HTH domain
LSYKAPSDRFSSWLQMVNRKSHDRKDITSAQIRAARALIRWTAEDLARKSDLGVATIRRAEATDGPLQMTVSNLAAVRRTLEAEGIEFIFEDDGRLGVRIRTINS